MRRYFFVIVCLYFLADYRAAHYENNKKQAMPENFVYLSDIDTTIIQNLRYKTPHNFLGRPVKSYQNATVMCTQKAAHQLQKVQLALRNKGYQLVIYDAYRPQSAVDEFVMWAEDNADTAAKPFYYPSLTKPQIFEQNFIAKKSGHSKGSTFDVTLIALGEKILDAPIVEDRVLNNGEKIPFLNDNTIDMGASFDFFHLVSHSNSSLISSEQQKMRDLLRQTMIDFGFKPYKEEWWHYTLVEEPYPNTYFDWIWQ